MSDAAIELSINERVNSQLYSDVISSYVDINAVTAQRNIVPGSYKETVVQCTDQTLATLNSAGGQTLFTRFKLTPQVRNATLAQLAQIYFQYFIPGDNTKQSLGFVIHKMAADAKENITSTGTTDTANVADMSSVQEHLKLKLFYDTGFSIASMVQLCLVADAKVSTENFNYQQSLLTLNSIPDFVTENSNCESTLNSLVHNESFRGVGSGLLDYNFRAYNAANNPTGLDSQATTNVKLIKTPIGIEGCIDLDRGNPLFHNFPIITRNMGELYIRLYMENFLRELKVVYLNKRRNPITTVSATGNITFTNQTFTVPSANPVTGSWTAPTTSANGNIKLTGTANGTVSGVTVKSTGAEQYLPYQRLPADKADFIYLDGELYKIRLVNLLSNSTPGAAAKFTDYTNPIYTLNNIQWTRFEIRKTEFDIEEYEDIKASQAKAGTYKFPVHIFRSKNFDQTNAASSSSNALQTTLNAPNIDRIFITQPWSRDYYTFLPTVPATDINPQLHNNPVLPRTEDCLNSRTIERIANVYTDTDKYSPSQDLTSSLDLPTQNKQLWLKGPNTYGGKNSFYALQKGIDDAHGSHTAVPINIPYIIPNKFAYGIELNEGGCFRRGFNSVIDGNYSPTVPINLQCSTATSDNIYFDTGAIETNGASADAYQTSTLASNVNFNSLVTYCNLPYSGAVASVHCLCDYIFWLTFDQFGMMTDFGVSEYNDRQ